MDEEEDDEDDELDVQEYQGYETDHHIRDHEANTFLNGHWHEFAYIKQLNMIVN